MLMYKGFTSFIKSLQLLGDVPLKSAVAPDWWNPMEQGLSDIRPEGRDSIIVMNTAVRVSA